MPLIMDKRDPSKRHCCLVVSPLKALINDQVSTLKAHGIAAYGITEGVDRADVEAIKAGNASILMASPEAAITRHWRDIFVEAYKDTLSLVTYDEAHCISEWGLDFRADYRKVGVLQSLFDCPVLSLSATVTKDIVKDVTTILSLREVNIISTLPDRPNNFISVVSAKENFEDELDWLLDLIREQGRQLGKIIVYVSSIAMCERLYIWLHSSLNSNAFDGKKDVNNRLVEMYHAHTDQESKERILTDFKTQNGTIRCLIATVAVGMGMDIPDISLVVIWGLPPSMLQLWQEAGRGGRDGRDCITIVYAYPRSVSLPCNTCRSKGAHTCSCASRVYLKGLATCTTCQRVYCLNFFAINRENEKDLEKMNDRESCNLVCDDTCLCGFCRCCFNCMKKCKCEKHCESLSARIKTVL